MAKRKEQPNVSPEEISAVMVELGRRGGIAPHSKPRGFAALTSARRSEIAKKAAEARWGKKATE